MTWTTIGTKAPIAGQWELFPVITESELFRFTHTWISEDWWKPRGLIAQVWGNSLLINPFKIYPRNGAVELIKMPIPLDFKFASPAPQTSRAIGVYLLTPYRPQSASYQWSLTIEGYTPATIPQATQDFDFDDLYSITGDAWDDIY